MVTKRLSPLQQIAKSRNQPAKEQGTKVKRHMDLLFLLILLVLLGFGLTMLFSASYAYSFYWEGNSFYYITRQLIYAAVGLAAMAALSFVDYHLLKRFAFLIYLIAIALLLVVFAMPPLNNARRWILLGFTTFQPSEVAKFAIIVIFARLIEQNRDRMNTFRGGVVPFLLPLGLVVGLVVLEPHVSGTILILLIAMSMMLIGGTKLSFFGIGGGLMGAALGVAVMFFDFFDYAKSRIDMWLNPWLDPSDEGFQIIQSLLAIGSGGFGGAGLGNSKQKYMYIPEPQNDFIFAIVCEELGFIGAVLIVILFALLVWRGMVISMRAKDTFGGMLAMGITIQVGIQAMFNIAVVTGLFPNTGISLPFFSYGGSSLMMLLAEMGVVLSVSRYSSVEKE